MPQPFNAAAAHLQGKDVVPPPDESTIAAAGKNMAGLSSVLPTPVNVPPGISPAQEQAARAARSPQAAPLTQQDIMELQTAVKNFRIRGVSDAQIRAKLVLRQVPEDIIKSLGL